MGDRIKTFLDKLIDHPLIESDIEAAIFCALQESYIPGGLCNGKVNLAEFYDFLNELGIDYRRITIREGRLDEVILDWPGTDNYVGVGRETIYTIEKFDFDRVEKCLPSYFDISLTTTHVINEFDILVIVYKDYIGFPFMYF